MSIEKTGVMISRAAGLIFIIIGASSLLYLFQPGAASSGWTGYSPGSTTTTSTKELMTTLHDAFHVMTSTASFYIPSAAEVGAGFVMILLSKPIGRWLAKGLSETDGDDAG